MDRRTLQLVMGDTREGDYSDVIDAFNEAMVAAECTTVLRAAMWCAQLGHESVGLKYMQEIGDARYFSKYDWRTDLGNNQPGDGARFSGHGPIQITGRHNHTRVSEWAYEQGLVPTPTFFVDNPNLMASTQYGFIGAVWYWRVARPNINHMCDLGDLVGVTKAINGGVNGITDRSDRYEYALSFGDRLLPTEAGPVWDAVMKELAP